MQYCESNTLVEILRSRVLQGQTTIMQSKFDLDTVGTFYLHLPGYDTCFIQSVLYRAKHYGLKFETSLPNIQFLRPNNRIYVIISNNLLECESNEQFLKNIGQGRFLTNFQKQRAQEYNQEALEKAEEQEIERKLTKTAGMNKRQRALLSPAAKMKRITQRRTSPPKSSVSENYDQKGRDEFLILDSLFKLILINQNIGCKYTYDLVQPIDLRFYNSCLNMYKTCTLQFHKDVDIGGGLKYQISKSLYKEDQFFGIISKKVKNQKENPPKQEDAVAAAIFNTPVSNRAMKMLGHSSKGFVKIDYAPPISTQKRANIADQQEVALPQDYYQFETYLPKNGEYERLNIPKFYEKSPFLAQTVIYSCTDIEKLDSQPELFKKFHESMLVDIQKYYSEIESEEQEDLIIDHNPDNFNFIQKISLKEQLQEQTYPNIYHCGVCKMDTDDYFGHVSSTRHKNNYMDTFDENSGTRIVDQIDKMFMEMRNEKLEYLSQKSKTTQDLSARFSPADASAKQSPSAEELPKPTPFFPNSNNDLFFNKSYISGKDKPKKYVSRKDLQIESQETIKDEKISVKTKTVVQVSSTSQDCITDYYEIKSRKNVTNERAPTEWIYKSPKKSKDPHSQIVCNFESSPIKTRSAAKRRVSPLRQLKSDVQVLKKKREVKAESKKKPVAPTRKSPRIKAMAEARTIGITNSAKKMIEIEIPKLPVAKKCKKISKKSSPKKPRGRPPKNPKVTIVIQKKQLRRRK